MSATALRAPAITSGRTPRRSTSSASRRLPDSRNVRVDGKPLVFLDSGVGQMPQRVIDRIVRYRA
jgi:hypothetical protein